jgi:hypothetical protein
VVGAPQGRIGGVDPETRTREQAPNDLGAQNSIERFDRIAFGQGDLGRVFRGGGAGGGDARFEEGRAEPLMAEGCRNANGE